MVRLGVAWQGEVRSGAVWQVGRGEARSGKVWCGLALGACCGEHGT